MTFQFLILTANLFLLILNGFLAIRLTTKKIPQISSSIPQPVLDIYKALNIALVSRQPILEVVVDDIPMHIFRPFYLGLDRYYGFKMNLKSRKVYDQTIEILEFDLASYAGPRLNLTPKMLYPEVINNPIPPTPPVLAVNQEGFFSPPPVPLFPAVRNKRVKKLTTSIDNVVDLDSYRKRKRG